MASGGGDVHKLIGYLNEIKNSGDDDGVHRRLWWFLFKPRHDCNYYRRVWCFKSRRLRDNLRHDNASCYLSYVREFNESLLLNYDLTTSIKVFQSGNFFVGYIKYTSGGVSRAKAMYDLKLRSWCLIGVPTHMYGFTVNLMCHQKEVVPFERKMELDVGELADIYHFVQAQVGMLGEVNLKQHLHCDEGWLALIIRKWVGNRNMVAYQPDMLVS